MSEIINRLMGLEDVEMESDEDDQVTSGHRNMSYEE